jgi:predicted metal-dependent phosphoesterase TrpH
MIGLSQLYEAFDLHIHTYYSKARIHKLSWNDGVSSPKDVIKYCKKLGLKGLAITDHNTLDGFLKARSLAKEYNLLLIPGYETKLPNREEVLLLGIDFLLPNYKLEEIKEEIDDNSGVIVKAHPFNSLLKNLKNLFTNCEKFDAFEINSTTPYMLNKIIFREAERKKIQLVGGSDSHHFLSIGSALTLFDDGVESVDDVVQNIKKGFAKAVQLASPYNLRFYVYLERLKAFF